MTLGSSLVGRRFVGSLWRGGAVGCLVGLVVAGVVTWQDWRLNPDGVFHGPAGTHWPAVAETLWSWWWPVALAVTLAVPLAVTLVVTLATRLVAALVSARRARPSR